MVSAGAHASQASVISLRDIATRRKRADGGSLKIVYVVSMFPAWSETFIVREILALLDAGVDVRIVSLRKPRDARVQDDARRLLDRVIHHRPWYETLPRLWRSFLRNPWRSLRHPALIVTRLWRHPVVMLKTLVTWFRAIGVIDDVRAFAPDHLHAHWATYPSTAAMILSGHLGTPFSVTAHAHDIFLEDQLMAEKLQRAAFVATISRHNRRYLRQRYPHAAATRIEIIHCGVPRELIRTQVTRSAPHDVPVVLSVGRHDEVKGFPTLLKACARLRDAGVAFRCEIVGDGPLRPVLEAEIRRLALDGQVTLLGMQPSDVIRAKLAAADVFVLASERARNGNMDGIPVALMEAMATGVPVVSTAISGIPELIEDGRSGLLARSGDPAALAAALERMLADAPLRQRCAEQARRKVAREFDAVTEAEKLLALFRTVSGERDAEKIADSHR